MKKILYFGAVVIIFSLAYYAYNMYFRSHVSVLELQPDYSLSAVELFEKYDTDETEADKLYLGKLIEVVGVINEIDNDPSSYKLYLDTGDLMSSIQCDFGRAANSENIEIGQTIKVRGFCSGKLIDIVLNKCEIVE